MATFKEGAKVLSDFYESPSDHVQKVCQFNEFEGNASLQNALELACDNFQTIPSYGRREVLILFSSLTNCDPGDIQLTIRKLVELKVKVSVVSLTAEVFVLQNLAAQTLGEFCLARSKDHLEDLMERFLVPNEIAADAQTDKGGEV